jgi:hypothetical protein
MKGLSKYKLNKAFTEGVDIRLDDAPDVVFRVRLPSQYNRGYTQALYSGLEWSLEDGEVKTGGSMIATRYVQTDAFMEHCLVSIDGEPVPDSFAEEYPEAVSELMNKTSELVEELESKVESTVGKSQTSSPGSESGQEKKPSIQSLSREAG